MLPDKSGKYAALYRPIHMIGLELGISVASCALRREATGAPTGFRSDVVATAKTVLKAGSMLDGEGGFCVWGKQTPADVSLERGLLPLGLAPNIKLRNDIAEGQALKWSDVVYDQNDLAVKVRREMEAAFGRRYSSSIVLSIVWLSPTVSMVSTMRALSASLPLMRPDATASRIAVSISRCEVTPTVLRNLRSDVLRTSSFIGGSLAVFGAERP